MTKRLPIAKVCKEFWAQQRRHSVKRERAEELHEKCICLLVGGDEKRQYNWWKPLWYVIWAMGVRELNYMEQCGKEFHFLKLISNHINSICQSADWRSIDWSSINKCEPGEWDTVVPIIYFIVNWARGTTKSHNNQHPISSESLAIGIRNYRMWSTGGGVWGANCIAQHLSIRSCGDRSSKSD